jgi:malate dehydrogenase (oxaloacetate-decarboxylating)(NADP+)
MASFTPEDALDYHSSGRPGKIEVIPTKPHFTQHDLSLAYTPGVALPCKEIEKNPEDAYQYTAKNNLVAVISNGTAVLGLGDIGALAGKPVMEGKGLLFKIFADIDVFDIEADQKDPEELIKTVKAISPTFGGINLEDIKAPECFEVEQRLIKELDIPVFHDDQHGTAIISGAGLLNALEINKKKIEDIRVVVCGAGASGISCAEHYVNLGVKRENVMVVDSKGVVSTDRKDLNHFKQRFAVKTDCKTLEDALVGADVFLGLSRANVVSQKMVRTMADHPIVFAMANPDPEISYEDAMASREDIIFATGRSDYPNQINNVLGFPFIFRGALDVRAKTINEEMKMAATKALADLAKEAVPDSVNQAYHSKNLVFGKEYLIPKPLDPRLITTVAPAVAKAAIETGVARNIIEDWDAYQIELMKRMGLYNKLVSKIRMKARQNPKRILFSDAEQFNILKAIEVVRREGIAIPSLLGDEKSIRQVAKENGIELDDIQIIDIHDKETKPQREAFAHQLFDRRRRKGLSYDEAYRMMYDRNYYGAMMVESGHFDGFIAGFSNKYLDVIRPALQIVGTNNSLDHIAGMHIVMTKHGPLFFGDTTVNKTPSGRTIADTTLLVANEVRKYNIEPVIAIVSYSNFGTTREGSPTRAQEAIEILHRDYPELLVDGEMQMNYAVNADLLKKKFPFSKIVDKKVNTIIFPNLSSGNIAFKMMQEIGEANVIGPILLGLRKPIHVLQMEASVREIINMAAITVIDAQTSTEEVIEF